MDRAIIFRYDDARRRVRAVGVAGIELDVFENAHLTGRVGADRARGAGGGPRHRGARRRPPEVPDEYRDLLREATLVCTPMSAAGRWIGRDPLRPRAGRRR